MQADEASSLPVNTSSQIEGLLKAYTGRKHSTASQKLGTDGLQVDGSDRATRHKSKGEVAPSDMACRSQPPSGTSMHVPSAFAYVPQEDDLTGVPLSSSSELSGLDKFLPRNNEDEANWEPVDVYSCNEFRMYEFKVRRCMRSRSHDWTECPFAHPGEKARRRDPRRFQYSATTCPDFRKGSCRRGDACEYAHGVFECWLHPARYRTQPCKDGRNCKRRICFFAHTSSQLRIPPAAAAGSTVPAKSSQSAQKQQSVSSPTSTLSPPVSPDGSSGASPNQPSSPLSAMPEGVSQRSSSTPSTVSSRRVAARGVHLPHSGSLSARQGDGSASSRVPGQTQTQHFQTAADSFGGPSHNHVKSQAQRLALLQAVAGQCSLGTVAGSGLPPSDLYSALEMFPADEVVQAASSRAAMMSQLIASLQELEIRSGSLWQEVQARAEAQSYMRKYAMREGQVAAIAAALRREDLFEQQQHHHHQQQQQQQHLQHRYHVDEEYATAAAIGVQGPSARLRATVMAPASTRWVEDAGPEVPALANVGHMESGRKLRAEIYGRVNLGSNADTPDLSWIGDLITDEPSKTSEGSAWFGFQ